MHLQYKQIMFYYIGSFFSLIFPSVNLKKINKKSASTDKIDSYTLRKKGTKAVNRAVPFQKVLHFMYI